ncbi:alkaline phosphatase family protein [Nocardioides sp. YIM 152315]|uniref:alkaline phosphatase family protein n=1 Tax=Nocardioides sp. YIM 152315 TaxID=3031760 RepID=UPI0023DB546A|nr:alkaline phosphatase family protein [Nocardioides sp. YIM 152315]MDF1606437.1 alkaline phosphatase family protein [Nocardioides sp. YIM 152315]
MARRSLLLPSCALVAALLAPVGATHAAPDRGEPASGARVLAISVDGLNPTAIKRLGEDGTPTFHRLLTEGAATLNARTEREQNVTLPNHTSMLTGRRIDARRGGHGVTWDDDRPFMTVQRAARHPVGSVFSVVDGSGGESALFSTKEKFRLYERSWSGGIDRAEYDVKQRRLVRTAVADLVDNDRPFTFLHVSLPDRFGHAYGGLSRQYLSAVRKTDRQLGTVLDTIEANPTLDEHLTVILTADHGFVPGRRTHTPRVLADFRVPFLVWGAGVQPGDLYALNPDYRNPRKTHPGYAAARQPVRNGDLANLALDLLGLDAVPGSELNADQDLDVS